MPTYRKRAGAYSYGHGVGLLLLDARAPFVPGDVGNATSYEYPVLYKTVPGLTTNACLGGEAGWEQAVVDAARALEKEGAKGLSSDCGFMIQFQEVVADAVDIPVALSSLLQLPMMARCLDPEATIGILTADDTVLTQDMLKRYGLDVPNPIVIRGPQDEPEFNEAIMLAGPEGSPSMSLDSDRIRDEAVKTARAMQDEHPEMAAVLIECSIMPPYAKAVQEAIDLPCFNFIDVIDYMHAGTRQRAYRGGY
ncbi:MAG: aspartate/glutamate racemase family protein [Rhodospirillaceae bacterium]|jgi:hypothetical protein|nr:aspartate/glutamate racemase family protein [Rhodospirillaceae bacterium]